MSQHLKKHSLPFLRIYVLVSGPVHSHMVIVCPVLLLLSAALWLILWSCLWLIMICWNSTSFLLIFHFLIAPLVDLLSCWTTKHWCNLAEYDQLEATRCVRLISPRGRKDDATCDREEMQTQNRKSQLSPTAFLRYLCPCPKDLGHVMFSKFKL